MNSSIINKEIVEFEVVDKRQAVEIRQEISELASTKIPVIIDEVVSKYFGKDDLLTLDRIEIDLGTFGLDNLEREFTKRFHKQFEEEIIKCGSINLEYISQVVKISSVEPDFELLTFFITSGSLPWWVANKQEIKIDEILQRIVKGDKHTLLAFLKAIASNKIFISRIVSQFSTSSIISLNQLLKDSDDSLKHYYNYANYFFGGELIRFITRTAFEQILFESLISYLSQVGELKAKTEFIALDFVGRILSMNLLPLSKVRTLFKKIITSGTFDIKPDVSRIEKQIKKYFTGNKYDISKNLPLLIKEIKDLISNKTFEEEVKEGIKLSESIEKEIILTKEITKAGIQKSNEIKKEITPSVHKKRVIGPDNEKFGKEPKLDIQKYAAEKKTKITDDTLQLEKGIVHKSGKVRMSDLTAEQKITSKGIGEEEKIELGIDNKIVPEEKNEFDLEEEHFKKPKSSQHEPNEIYIDNSGLVLIAAFMPAFFKSLGLIENDKFKNNKYAERGVHLLQYLVNEKEKSPEYVLAINKILCGLDIFHPISNSIKITTREKEESNSLLNSVIKNWSVLKNTSIEGFRNSFLIRNGIITIEECQFNLKVERKSYDLLLNHLPWSISIIKHNWMNKPVYVEW